MVMIKGIGCLATLCHTVEGRLGKIEPPLFNKLWHFAIEIGHEQSSDMRPIYICICHDNHFAIAQGIKAEIFAALYPQSQP